MPETADSSRFQPVHFVSGYTQPKANIDPNKKKGWVKRLYPIVRSHPLTVAAGIIFGLISVVSQAFVPYVIRWGIDAAESTSDSATADLQRSIFIVGILGIARAAAGVYYRSSFFKLAFGVDSDLRNLVYSHLTRLSFAFYDRTVSGEIVSRANTDIRSIQLFFAFAPLGITSLMVFVIALGLMLTIHIPLTLVALSVIPFTYYLGIKFRNIVFPLSWITQSRLAEVATIVDESTNGAHVVKAFSAEKEQVKLLAQAAKRVRWSLTETIRSRAKYNPVIEALPKLGMAGVLGYGGWLVIEGQISIGTLFAFSAYVIMSLVPFRMLGFLIMQARRSAAAAERVYEILDTPVDIPDAEDAEDLDKPAGNIRFENVHFTYPTSDLNPEGSTDIESNGFATREPVLKGISMEIKAGETIAIVGATGSGKSTIARLLARFYEFDSGEILIDGKDIRGLTQTSLRHYVGLVFDDPFLFSMSLSDNIAFASPGADQAEIQQAAEYAEAHNFITGLPEQYETVIGERGYTLSGGQRQRVALARVFLCNPAVLILDDATSAVDVETESRIHQNIKNRTSTILVMAHRLSTITLANRVLLLDNGTITDSGTHEELLERNHRYREILAETMEGEITAAAETGIDS